jgi:hypothetical protein
MLYQKLQCTEIQLVGIDLFETGWADIAAKQSKCRPLSGVIKGVTVLSSGNIKSDITMNRVNYNSFTQWKARHADSTRIQNCTSFTCSSLQQPRPPNMLTSPRRKPQCIYEFSIRCAIRKGGGEGKPVVLSSSASTSFCQMCREDLNRKLPIQKIKPKN